MIRNENEYRKALDQLEQDALFIQAQRDQLQNMGITGEELERAMQPVLSFQAQLKEEVEAYDQMRRGELPVLYSFSDIGRWLIGVRIAQGISQKELAERLGISEAQVSRDERNEYHGIGVDRAQHILHRLGVQFRIEGNIEGESGVNTERPEAPRPTPEPAIAQPPVTYGGSTPERIAAFLRADKNLGKDKADRLAEMMRLAYEAAVQKAGK